jgi:hypothetical protein
MGYHSDYQATSKAHLKMGQAAKKMIENLMEPVKKMFLSLLINDRH